MTDRSPDPPLDRRVLRKAAQWLVRLHPGAEPSPEALRECERWRAENPDHERAWQRARQLHDQFAALPSALARSTLQRQRARRKALAVIGTLGTVVPVTWLAWRLAPIDVWTAQYRTSTGERRELRLADGSTVLMNAVSAMDFVSDMQARTVWLRTGEILVHVAPDSRTPDTRPFVVTAAAGSMCSLDARFIVRQRDKRCHVEVLDGAVAVTPRDQPERRLRLETGTSLVFTASCVATVLPVTAGVDAWSRGALVANEMRLADFLDALSYYRPGLLQCDPAVADMRLSGGYQLQDTDKILALLPSVLPVRVVSRSRYWVVVEPRRLPS